MKRLVLIFTIFFMISLFEIKMAVHVDPDATRNVSELITSKDYPLEEHIVQTPDGYLLSVQRIPRGKNSSTDGGSKGVVLLIHGEVGDSKTWFLNPPGQGLGYILPDAGYDTWMVNCRGSTYSKKNIYYPTRSYKFWNFTFEDIAKYDATATIDYILNATGEDALYIIGYSRGNTVGFTMLSELPEYNKKVRLLVAFAPIAFIGHFRTAIKVFIPFAEAIAGAINAVTQGEFLPDNKAVRAITAKFCKVQKIGICENVLFAIAGFDYTNTNMSRVHIYSAQYPSSTSTKILLHFAQLHRSKKFRKYDYGLLKNLEYYKQLTPPDYQLSRITAPVALFHSLNDAIADPIDVAILRRRLKSVVFDYRIPGPKGLRYNHFDFIWAVNAPELVYNPLLKLMEKY